MSEKITINLDKTGYDFSEGEIIHIKELEQAKSLINEFVKSMGNLESICHDKELPLDYRTILINGPRGSGKTSFLHSLFNLDGKGSADGNTIKTNNLCFLGHLDPTMIEEKAHIFLMIIAMIRQKVYEKLDSEDDNFSICNKKQWNDLLEKFAKGLPILDAHKEDPDFWDDAAQIMYKGLDETLSSYNTRKNFNTLVEYSLKILGRNAFIIAIDDVDTDFRKTFPMLETLRKYINIERIIILVSGDLDLFSLAIRKQQLEDMGDKLIKTGIISQSMEIKNYILKCIAELENQYIKKIFPSQYQIRLKTLKQISETSDINIISHQISEKEISINNFYNKILSSFGMYNTYQRNTFYDLLENLPLRTQVQFMKIYKMFIDKKDEIPYIRDKEEIEISDILNIFITELHYKNINLDNILTAPPFIIISILQLLLKEKKIDELYQLQPISNDFILNCCLTTLSFLLSLKIADTKDLFFDYLIRIGYLRNLQTYFPRKTDETSQLSIKGLIKHANMENNRDLHQMCCYLTSYIRSINENGKFSGIVKLLGFASKSKNSERQNTGRFDFELKNLSLYEQQVACLPLSISKPVFKDNTINEYSVWTLIAVVGDLIREIDAENNNKSIENNQGNLINIISQALDRQSQIRQFPMIDTKLFSSGNISPITEYNDEETFNSKYLANNKQETIDIKFYEKMIDWLKKTKDLKFTIAPYVIAKIATRLFYSFDNIERNYQDDNLGDIMHLFICQLFHAVIIEEFQESRKIAEENIQINNIVSTTELLKNNLKKTSNLLKEDKLPLSKMILTCPLFLMFINFNDINSSTNILLDNSDKTFNLYDNLKRIKLHPSSETSFSVANAYYKHTIEILKSIPGLSLDSFLSDDIEDIIAKITPYFSRGVTEKNIERLREIITKHNIKW